MNRLLELAIEAAEAAHYEPHRSKHARHDELVAGHSEVFETCPHPDCLLVRGGEPQTDQPIRGGLSWAENNVEKFTQERGWRPLKHNSEAVMFAAAAFDAGVAAASRPASRSSIGTAAEGYRREPTQTHCETRSPDGDGLRGGVRASKTPVNVAPTLAANEGAAAGSEPAESHSLSVAAPSLPALQGLTRYEPTWISYYRDSEMEPNPDGSWVKWSDLEALVEGRRGA